MAKGKRSKVKQKHKREFNARVCLLRYYRKYRLLKKYGPEITWTRIMMDQNNYGPFGIFFFYGPISGFPRSSGVFEGGGRVFFPPKKIFFTSA